MEFAYQSLSFKTALLLSCLLGVACLMLTSYLSTLIVVGTWNSRIKLIPQTRATIIMFVWYSSLNAHFKITEKL